MMAYLRDNVAASQVLGNAAQSIREFRARAPVFFASKCIDGRVHGSDGKGYPPTTVTFSRTEGNRVSLTPENIHFWTRVNAAVLDAQRHTTGTPAIFIALAHRSELGSGCAAHAENDDDALEAAREQAEAIRKKYGDRFYVLHGITNTDDGSEMIVFPDGHKVDTASIIALLNTPPKPLTALVHAFKPRFTENAVDDVSTSNLIYRKKPVDILTGSSPALFTDLQTMIAMESYFLREISSIVSTKDRNNVVFDDRLIEHIQGLIGNVKDLPPSLKAPLVYQTFWNVLYALYRRNYLASLGKGEQYRELEHAEKLVGYGEGFETARRNSIVLAKPGRGDDRIALSVARRVLEQNRQTNPQPHPPVVHVNTEITGTIADWADLNTRVLGPLLTRMQNVHDVFGTDCRVLLSYSRYGEKCFYPIRLVSDQDHARGKEDERESLPYDITRNMSDVDIVSGELERRENAYRLMMKQ